MLEFQTSWQQEFPSRVFKREHFPTCTLRAHASGSYRKANSCRWECCKALTTPHTCGMCEGGAQLSGDLTSGTGSRLRTELQVGVKSAVILNDCVSSLGLRVLQVILRSAPPQSLHWSSFTSLTHVLNFSESLSPRPRSGIHCVAATWLSNYRVAASNCTTSSFCPNTVAGECKYRDEFTSLHPRLCPTHLHPNPFSIQFGSNG